MFQMDNDYLSDKMVRWRRIGRHWFYRGVAVR